MASGFARFRCSGCAREILVAFSCKGRGFCPSCCGRRMAVLAAHLVDGVLGDLPARQWVLTLPHRLRYALAYDPPLCRAVLAVFAVAGLLCAAAPSLVSLVAGRALCGVGTGLFYEPLVCREINAGIVDYLERHGFRHTHDDVNPTSGRKVHGMKWERPKTAS